MPANHEDVRTSRSRNIDYAWVMKTLCVRDLNIRFYSKKHWEGAKSRSYLADYVYTRSFVVVLLPTSTRAPGGVPSRSCAVCMHAPA